MVALALLENDADMIRKERVFRDHGFPAHVDDDWLICRFRFPRPVLLDLCAELGPVLDSLTCRICASYTGVNHFGGSGNGLFPGD